MEDSKKQMTACRDKKEAEETHLGGKIESDGKREI